jgi:hypothetical protein
LKNSKLTPLQMDFLAAFFRRERRFFLTGGAALAGFHLGHRETHDLDLFTVQDILDEGTSEISAVARELGAAVESIQTAPDFRRFLLQRAGEGILIDLVRDRVVQLVSEKTVIDGIRIDSPEEILANKLCALLSRAEVRDLVDVHALEAAGYLVEEAIQAAARKDAGLTAAQLGWILSQIRLGPDLAPPGGISRMELQQYLDELVKRLARLAYPFSEV